MRCLGILRVFCRQYPGIRFPSPTRRLYFPTKMAELTDAIYYVLYDLHKELITKARVNMS